MKRHELTDAQWGLLGSLIFFREAVPSCQGTEKSFALTASVRMPLHLEFGQGQDHDIIRTAALLAAAGTAGAAAIIADTARDSGVFRTAVEAEDKEIVVTSHPKRNNKPFLNAPLYALRYNVERFFFGLKRVRPIASR